MALTPVRLSLKEPLQVMMLFSPQHVTSLWEVLPFDLRVEGATFELGLFLLLLLLSDLHVSLLLMIYLSFIKAECFTFAG